jgi:arginine decarboxylase
MTGATPIYLVPSRNGLGIIGPISRDQFTPASMKAKIAANPHAKKSSGKVRQMVITNSTYDGLCYNIDEIEKSLADSVEVLHFDEAWYAYANFHEFYDGHHGIHSSRPERKRKALTFVTQSTHKLLAALSQASMIHVQQGAALQLDMLHFNDAFMMHTSTSPQYGIIASCDVAAAMMEQPAGRALVQEMIDEALAFRRAMFTVGKELGGKWWFRVWQPDAMAEKPTSDRDAWVLKPGEKWHGFEGLAEKHVLVDPVKVTILTPGLSADGKMAETGIPATIVTKFLSGRRIEIEKTGLYSVLVLFSMGVTKGKWSTLVTELINFRDLYESNAPLSRALPKIAESYPEAYGSMGLKDLCTAMHKAYAEHDFAREQREMYTALPEMALLPADAYDKFVHGAVEAVDIDKLMGRIAGVMVVPYPPGIPVIMPGERITATTKSIQDYLLNARSFDHKFPGFETDIHGLRFEGTGPDRRYMVDCIKES